MRKAKKALPLSKPTIRATTELLVFMWPKGMSNFDLMDGSY